MIKLSKADHFKFKPLIKSENEISAFGVIEGIIPGEIFANCAENPTTVLIKTCECNIVV